MRPPFERPQAESKTRHHLWFEKPQWHSREWSRRVSTLGSFVVGADRAPHDYLHATIKPPTVPSKIVADRVYEIGREFSGFQNDTRRIGQIVEEMTFDAQTERSPQRAHEMWELATSLTAQMAIVDYFKSK